jgi:hypothetical protein
MSMVQWDREDSFGVCCSWVYRVTVSREERSGTRGGHVRNEEWMTNAHLRNTIRMRGLIVGDDTGIGSEGM